MSTQAPEDHLSEKRAPVTADLGGAIVFIWDIDRLETF